MSDLLFNDLPEDLSPKLQWMRRHHIQVQEADDGGWIAYKSRTNQFYRNKDKDIAIAGLAKKLKLRLWNEEPV
jgi:hypothetical protein